MILFSSLQIHITRLKTKFHVDKYCKIRYAFKGYLVAWQFAFHMFIFVNQKKEQLSSNLISYLEVLIWCIDLTANNCYIKRGLNIDQFVSQALIDVRSFF